MMCSIPITVPVKLCTSCNGASITPQFISTEFTIPRRCKITSHA